MLTKEFLIENKRNLQNMRDILTIDNLPSEFINGKSFQFNHLHNHSEYSRLDGALNISDMVERASELDCSAVALTDHGYFNGIVELEDSVKSVNTKNKTSIKAVYGMEGYMCEDMNIKPRGSKDKTPYTPDEKRLLEQRYHIILLAKNSLGVKAINILSSKAHLHGFYRKPRFDFDLLTSYIDDNDLSKGRLCDHLVVMSACIGGEIPQMLINVGYDEAKKVAQKYRDNIEDFYLEIQLHKPVDNRTDLDDHEKDLILLETKVNKEIFKLSQELSIPVVATNDAHFVKKEDFIIQEILTTVDSKKTLDDPTRTRLGTPELYLKTPNEMMSLFGSYPDVMINTVIISELCNVERITRDEYFLPEFDFPKEYNSVSDYFKHLSWENYYRIYTDDYLLLLAKERNIREKTSQYTLERLREETKIRMDYELSVITGMGYDNYYLINWDMLNFAFRQNIPLGRGRGSGAGSIIAFVLGIVWVDPIRWELIFERFLNPERVSLPDFDNDICYKRREEVINYLIEKYGEDKVSQIITFGTFAARGSIRDVARVLDKPYSLGDKIAKKIPQEPGITIKKALDSNPELKQMYTTDEDAYKVIEYAMKIEGFIRNLSTHAAGVVLMNEPTHNLIPVCKTADKTGVEVQLNMNDVERVGGVKFDLLGLRTATSLYQATALIKENEGIDIDLYNLDIYDKESYKLLRDGNTVGVFQLESLGMRNTMKELFADVEDVSHDRCFELFERVIAGISLYRPGPMKSIPSYIQGKKQPEKIKYVTSKLEPILNITYGQLVYQEQVMKIVRDLAGYTFGRSDLVRRAMGKKKVSVMEAEKQVFIYGEVKCPNCNGVGEKEGETCFDCNGKGVISCNEPNQEGEVTVTGCIRNGISKESAEYIYADMSDFAKYAFNKSHACAYAKLSYEGLFLKTHYPVYFMTALLSSVIGNKKKTISYIAEAKRMGIKVLPPDINRSRSEYSVSENKKDILIGFTALKNVGNIVSVTIEEEKKIRGNFKDINDFKLRMKGRVDKSSLTSLIEIGAFDSLGVNRNQLLNIFDEILCYKKESNDEVALKESYGGGLFALIGDNDFGFVDPNIIKNIPQAEEPSFESISVIEKELLGLYLTHHPLDDIFEEFIKNVTATGEMVDAMDIQNEKMVIIGGVILEKSDKPTKKGDMISTLIIDDNTGGQINAIVFSKKYKKFSDYKEGDIILIKGIANHRVVFGTEDEMEIQINALDVINYFSSKDSIDEFTKAKGKSYTDFNRDKSLPQPFQCESKGIDNIKENESLSVKLKETDLFVFNN